MDTLTLVRTCRNCDADLTGTFCSACGQRALEGRLSFRVLWDNFIAQFFKLERGVFRTLRDMTRRPGDVILGYIAGKRRRYVNPFTYLVAGSAVTLLSFALVSDIFEGFMRASMESRESAMGLEGAQKAAYIDMTLGLTKYSTQMMLAMAVPFALMLRLLFRKSGLNLAEISVYTLFTYGHVMMLSGIAAFAYPLLPLAPSTMPVFILFGSFLFYFLVIIVTSYQTFGRKIWSVVKALFAYLVSYVIYSAVMALTIRFIAKTFY